MIVNMHIQTERAWHPGICALQVGVQDLHPLANHGLTRHVDETLAYADQFPADLNLPFVFH
jgi:hypothetical protein